MRSQISQILNLRSEISIGDLRLPATAVYDSYLGHRLAKALYADQLERQHRQRIRKSGLKPWRPRGLSATRSARNDGVRVGSTASFSNL